MLRSAQCRPGPAGDWRFESQEVGEGHGFIAGGALIAVRL